MRGYNIMDEDIHKHPLLGKLRKALEGVKPGWTFSGPYVPGGKAGYYTFRAKKGNEETYLHVNEIDLSIIEDLQYN